MNKKNYMSEYSMTLIHSLYYPKGNGTSKTELFSCSNFFFFFFFFFLSLEALNTAEYIVIYFVQWKSMHTLNFKSLVP
jgi:hypothetical protein